MHGNFRTVTTIFQLSSFGDYRFLSTFLDKRKTSPDLRCHTSFSESPGFQIFHRIGIIEELQNLLGRFTEIFINIRDIGQNIQLITLAPIIAEAKSLSITPSSGCNIPSPSTYTGIPPPPPVITILPERAIRSTKAAFLKSIGAGDGTTLLHPPSTLISSFCSQFIGFFAGINSTNPFSRIL